LALAGCASPAPTADGHRSTRAFLLAERDLLPESIAYDRSTGAFFVGSMHRRKIVRRAPDGTVADWAGPEDGLWSIIGIKIDSASGDLLANSCNLGDDLPMTPPDSSTVGRGALLRLRLSDGAVVERYDAPPSAGPICFNDLAIGPRGDVYLTSGRNGIWHLAPGADRLDQTVQDTSLWLNGIAIGPEGALYAADDSLGPLLVDPASGHWQQVSVPPQSDVRSIDGLYVHGRSLVWIQNGGRPGRVVQAPFARDSTVLAGLRVLDSAHPDYRGPTTGVMVGDTLFYVATAQLGAIRPGGKIAPADSLRENVILRLTIPAR
jgi:sugar lactone lactonase YvrE